MIWFDLETEPIRPGLQAPPLACLQVAGSGIRPVPGDPLAAAAAGVVVAAASSPTCTRLVERILSGVDHVVGFNTPFDLIVLMENTGDADRVLALVERGLAVDLRLREQLLWVAIGRQLEQGAFDLGTVCAAHNLPSPEKTSPWRLRFGGLASVPVANWPPDAVEYAVGDVRCLPALARAQDAQAARVGANLGVAARLTADATWRDLLSVRGLVTDPRVVGEFSRRHRRSTREAAERLTREGLAYLGRDGKYHLRANSTRQRVAKEWANRGRRPRGSGNPGGYRVTKAGAALDARSLSELKLPWADAYATFSGARYALARVAEVEAGLRAPIHTRYGLEETGRAASWGPNVTNRKKTGLDRECFYPGPPVRKARVPHSRLRSKGPETTLPETRLCYLIYDHSGLELDTFAQVLTWTVGWSKLREAIVAGYDLHSTVGSQILNLSYEAFVRGLDAGDPRCKQARQVGKRLNFARAGGAGAKKIAATALAEDGMQLVEDDWEANVARWAEHCRAWNRTWPEVEEYFRLADQVASGTGQLVAPISGMVRGGCSYTDACNGPFQSLGALLTHDVLGRLQRATRATPGGPLDGCRVEMYVHDEYAIAVPDDPWLEERGAEVERIMVETARKYLPDLEPKADGHATRRWSKRARRVVGADGRLRCWEYHPLVEAIHAVGMGRDDVELADDARAVLTALGRDDRTARRELDARLCASLEGWSLGPDLEGMRQIAERTRLDFEARRVKIIG